MSDLCFDRQLNPTFLKRLLFRKVLPEHLDLIAEYGGKKTTFVLKQIMARYPPKPTLQRYKDGQEYLALCTTDGGFNGFPFLFKDHQQIIELNGRLVPEVLQAWTTIELDRLEGRDFDLAQAAVLECNWTDETKVWETLSVETACFFFFFGGLGGHIVRILDILKGAPPRQKNTLTMFAVLGFLNFQDCSVELPKVDFSVVERLTEFLYGEEELKPLISVLLVSFRAIWPEACLA